MPLAAHRLPETCVHVEGCPVAACPICRMTPAEILEERPPAKVAAPPKAPKPHLPVDPIDQFTAEFLDGMRCLACCTLRDAHGLCDCAREAVFTDKALQIAVWENTHGDPEDKRKMVIHGASASGRKRAALQAGYRETPSGVGTLPRAQAVNLFARISQGTSLDWRNNNRPSGDELPL
jgi:hypothetical protein